MLAGPLLNLNELHEITQGDPKVERELMTLFIKTAEDCLRRMRGLSTGATAQDWENTVHELKGASGNIRAVQMAALCAESEKLQDSATRIRAYEKIREAFEQVRPLLQEPLPRIQ